MNIGVINLLHYSKIFCFILAALFLCCNYANADDFDDEFSAFEDHILESKTEIYDPLEPMNRKILIFNNYADEYFLDHAVNIYQYVFPSPIRKGIRNFFDNLFKPFSAINSFAQGKTDNGLSSLSSFIINSTIGIFGFIDIAKTEKILYNKETFGQTLGYYGVPTGPYLVLPILGPSTVREFSSDMAEAAISPIGFDVLDFDRKANLSIDDDTKIGLAGLMSIDKKESVETIIKDIKKDSLDYYSTLRSYYLQNLKSKVQK